MASSTPSFRPRSRRSSVADGLKEMANILINKPKQVPPLRDFRKMSKEEYKLLASILCHQPPPSVARDSEWWIEFSARTKNDIAKLPGQLRSYPTVLERGANHLMDNQLRAAYREFCPMHQKLNQKLVRSTLHWVKRDVDIHIPAMIKPLRDTGRLPADVVNLFDKMNNASGMWLEKNNFQAFFGRRVPTKWKRQEDRCAACVLARLGSDITVLTALKAGMLARPRKKPGDGNRRMEYVDCMIKNFDDIAIHEALMQSTHLGNQVARLFTQWKADTEYGGGTSQPALGVQPATLRQPFDATQFPGYDASPKPATSSQPSSSRRTGSSRTSMCRSPPLPPPSSGILPINPDFYEPIPWRNQTHAGPPAGPCDTIDNLIENYRRTIYDPSFGQEDHSGFDRDPDDGEEWQGQDVSNFPEFGGYPVGGYQDTSFPAATNLGGPSPWGDGKIRGLGGSNSRTGRSTSRSASQSQNTNRAASPSTYDQSGSRPISPLISAGYNPRQPPSKNEPARNYASYGHQRSASRRGSNSTMGSIDPRKMNATRRERASRGTTFTDVSRSAEQRRETRWDDLFNH